MRRKFMHFLMLATLVAVSSVALADPPARVGRVTVTEGKVSMLVNGEEETGNLVNWPVTSENHVTTAPGARAEFRVGSAAVRLDGDSDIEIEQLDDERMRLRLNYGSASVRMRDPAMLAEFELTTPQARVVMTEPGIVRVDTERAPDTTVVNVLAGSARVDGAGTMLTARAGKRVEVRGDDVFTGLAKRDSFDDWAATRDRREEGMVASRYVPNDMTGYEDLDHYGNWVDNREYGAVWFPRAVPVGWAPYRDGRWVWISPWGWTWVDNSPWGYAPFHYGRWVVISGRWCWTPGRVVGRSVWSPALVGWVGGSNWSVSFSSGRSGPAVGWYPLSPRDRFVPSYRISSERERRLTWNHRTNERWHDRWKDRDHDGRRDGVTALPRDHFDRNRRIAVTTPARVSPNDVRNVAQIVAPAPTAATVGPGRQRPDGRIERDERGNRDRFERNVDRNQERGIDRGIDRNIDRSQTRTVDRDEARGRGPDRAADLAPARAPERAIREERSDAADRGDPRSVRQEPVRPAMNDQRFRNDREEREAMMQRNSRIEQQRSVITTAPAPQPAQAPQSQQGVLSTTPPARQDFNPGRGRRDEDGRPDFSRAEPVRHAAPAPVMQAQPRPQPQPQPQIQMAPARPVQATPQPQPRQEPRQEQKQEQRREKEERREGERFR